MAKNEITWAVKILGIVGGILCGVSLIVPWGGFDFGGAGISIYPWGTSVYSPVISEWQIFNIESFTQSPSTETILFAIFMILTFVFALIAFIIGILGFRHIGVRYSNSFLIAGILAVVAMIMYIIGIGQINTSEMGGFGIGYGAGFFLIIVGFILFFVAYGLQKALIPMAKPTVTYQQPMYQQQGYQQPAYHQPVYQQPPPQPAYQQPAQQASQDTFCPECGTKVLPGAKFCSKCGKTF